MRVRMRWPLVLPHHLAPDPPERIARHVWNIALSPEAKTLCRKVQRDIKHAFKDGDTKGSEK
jgi:hypothetical protein